MAIITIPAEIEKGTLFEVTLDMSELLAEVSDAYFSVQANLSKVLVYYSSTDALEIESNQRKILTFDASIENPSCPVIFSVTSRDLFVVKKIKLVDNDGGSFDIPLKDIDRSLFEIDFSAVAPGVTASLLLHFNQSFVDSSISGKTLTEVGSPVIQTSVKKFGQGSLQCPTNADYVTISATKSELLGDGDFTIEGWIYPTQSNGGFGDRFLTFHTGSNDSAGMVFYTYNGTIAFNLTSSSAPSQKYVTAGNVNANLNQWNHYAFVKSGNNLLFFVNGVQSFSGDFTNTNINFTNIWVGLSPLVGGVYQGFRGYIDEIRIAKSAVYTEAFTPPVIEFTPVEPL